MALPCSIMKCMSQTSDDIADADADANGIPIAANRRVLVLRALRIGGLVAVLPSMILAVVWWNNFPLPPDLLRSFLQLLLPLPALWVASGLVRKVCRWFEEEFVHTIWRRARKFFASLVAVYTIAVTGWHVHRWWHFYAGFSFSIIVLLTLAALTVALGLATTVDLWLRGIRDQRDILSGAPDDPVRFRPFRPAANDEDDSDSPRRRSRRYWGRRFIALLAPALALTLTLLLVHNAPNPVVQTTTHAPDGPLPTRPTRLGARIAWEKDVPGLLEMAAGAAGPVLFTGEGLTALNPADGSVLWSYRRDKASYIRLPPLDYENPQGPRFTTSPTGRHIAFRIRSAKDLTDQHRDSADKTPVYDAVTITLDTLTGQVTGEHPSNTAWRIQLSDSALLDGDTAYNLADGQRRWSIERPRRSTLEPASKSTDYSGPAGHNSFILHYARNGLLGLHSDNVLYGNLIIVSDTDPTKVSDAVSIAVDGRHPAPVVAGGWVAHFTEPIDVQDSDPDKSGTTFKVIAKGIETEAVTLDSLAGLEPKSPVALGRTTGINSFASSATGTLAAYPDYSPDTLPISDIHNRYNKPKVGAVFDPVTRTTTQASQYPGLAAAKAGIAVTTDDGSGTGAIIMQPGDGSQATTIPITPGTTTLSPEALGARSPDALSQLATPDKEKDDSTIFMTAPGLTLVAFDPEAGVGYKTYIKEKEVGYVHRHVHRLYGLTGES